MIPARLPGGEPSCAGVRRGRRAGGHQRWRPVGGSVPATVGNAGAAGSSSSSRGPTPGVAGSPCPPRSSPPCAPTARSSGSNGCSPATCGRNTGSSSANPPGKPIDPRRDCADWKDLRTQAGLRDARLHDAGDTAATVLLVEGVDPRTVMDVMGWSEQRMLSRQPHVVDELHGGGPDGMGTALWDHADTEDRGK